jgi:hypothetical protein
VALHSLIQGILRHCVAAQGGWDEELKKRPALHAKPIDAIFRVISLTRQIYGWNIRCNPKSTSSYQRGHGYIAIVALKSTEPRRRT